MVNPAGVQHQIHGNVLQTTSRALKEQVPRRSRRRRSSQPRMGQLPDPELPRGAGGRGRDDAAPGRAAAGRRRVVVGAGHRGDRQRDLRRHRRSFPPAAVHAGGRPRGADRHPLPAPPARPAARAGRTPGARRRAVAADGGALVARARRALAAAVVGARRALVGVAALARRDRAGRRGRQPRSTAQRPSSAAGSSPRSATASVCHTAPGGVPNAGGLRDGRRRSAPSSSTNLTPDRETGIGAWSFSAFQRAMREGISRDGHHLYPAFPVHRVHAHHRRRPDRALRLPDGAAGGAVDGAADPAGLSVQRAAADGAVERDVPDAGGRCGGGRDAVGRSGTAASTWSTAPATAAPATPPRNALGAERDGAAASAARSSTAGKRRR